jgi:hypothetical protein
MLAALRQALEAQRLLIEERLAAVVAAEAALARLVEVFGINVTPPGGAAVCPRGV